LLFFLIFKTSLPIILSINDIGVIIKKKITAITIGEIRTPNKRPKLNQILLNNDKKTDLIRVIKNKINAKNKNIIFISPAFLSGHNPIIVKKIVKTKPKLLLEPILIFLLFI